MLLDLRHRVVVSYLMFMLMLVCSLVWNNYGVYVKFDYFNPTTPDKNNDDPRDNLETNLVDDRYMFLND